MLVFSVFLHNSERAGHQGWHPPRLHVVPGQVQGHPDLSPAGPAQAGQLCGDGVVVAVVSVGPQDWTWCECRTGRTAG